MANPGNHKHGARMNNKAQPEYTIWRAMKSRCQNPKTAHYEQYGGRGIRVCMPWNSFEQFLKDMGPRPSPQHTIDRINNNRGYNKKNCRWATMKEQQNNRRNNVRVEIEGEVKTLSQWCEIYGIHISTVHKRTERGWTVVEALQKPLLRNRKKKQTQET